jgi:general secretion pathway protein F
MVNPAARAKTPTLGTGSAAVEYRVKALDREHAVLASSVDAVDEPDARRQLGLLGLRVISLTPARRTKLWPKPAKVPLVIFSQELVALLDAGLSLVESIEALTEKEHSAAVRRPLEQILNRLYEGQTLGAALAEHPNIFPDLYVATVRASERTGSLREALARFITYQQQIDSLRKTLINASLYPAILLGAGILVTLFLMVYVVPRFSSIYEELGSDLPFASRLLLQWGKLLEAHTMAVVAVGAGLAAALGYGLSRPATRAALGSTIARLPTIGRQLRLYQLARLYRTVGMLLRSGMPAVTAMNMSSGLLSEALRASFAQATRAVKEGQSIANAMERHGLTTPVAARMLRVGERSGNMGEMTERIAAFYDEELARWVSIVTRLIEPLFMTVIGLLIGVIVVLMYFPIFQLAGSVQ